VHRDLKPSNILVTDDGQPKVLDFGIAQALGAGGGGRVSGTPAYMSPEQLLGGPIDVRTDVWSLGAVAFELYSGRAPLAVEGLTRSKLLWAVTSQPIPALGELAPALRGDIEAIVGRALQRDVDARYRSAEDLADDLGRHLTHRPVNARPATAPYRVGRWLRRNVGLSLAIGLVISALGLGTALAFERYVEADAARRTEAAQRRALQAALQRAEVERARAEAVTEFLADVFAEAHPDNSPGREVTVFDAMQSAATGLDDGELADQPAVEVAVRAAMAWAFRGLSHDDEAVAMLERAVELRPEAGPTDDGAMAAMFLADIRRGDHNDSSMRALQGVVSDLERLHPDQTHEMWQGYFHTLGRVHRAGSRYAEAEEAFRQALRIADERPDALPPTATWNQLAHTLRSVGRFDEARPLYERALQADREAWGEHHPQVATDLVNLGRTASLSGDPSGVDTLAEALGMREELLGADHRRTNSARLALVLAQLDHGRPDEAEALLATARASYERAHGAAPTDGVWHMARSRVAVSQGRVDEGVTWGRQAVARYLEELGGEHTATQSARVALAEAVAAAGQRDAARALLDEALSHLVATVGPHAPATQRANDLLAELGDGPGRRGPSVGP